MNYASHQSQCYLRLPFAGLAGERWRLRDLLGTAQYDRDGDDLQSRGLYLDVPPWQCHAFEMTKTSALRDDSRFVKWISPLAAVTVFTVMLSLGLLLEREQIISALRRRMVLAAVLFAVVVPCLP